MQIFNFLCFARNFYLSAIIRHLSSHITSIIFTHVKSQKRINLGQTVKWKIKSLQHVQVPLKLRARAILRRSFLILDLGEGEGGVLVVLSRFSEFRNFKELRP